MHEKYFESWRIFPTVHLSLVESQTSMAAGGPKVDAAYRDAVKQASADIMKVIKEQNCIPVLIRLAFNDALTYDAPTNTSGANGSIRCTSSLLLTCIPILSSKMRLIFLCL